MREEEGHFMAWEAARQASGRCNTRERRKTEKRVLKEEKGKRGGKMKPRSYPSDLADEEWTILQPLIPPAKPGGHPRTPDMREVINAILYLDRTGAQ
jgi:hypothetical protein